MATLRTLRVVVASPSDVKREREAVPKIADAVNRELGETFGVRLEVFRWETDTGPGFHPRGAQGVIDEKLRIDDCDLLIVVFWAKYGTPVADAASGTEHEFMTAYGAWKERGRPAIHVYFSERPIPPGDRALLQDAQRVADFKERISGEAKYETFATTTVFKEKVRQALVEFMTRNATRAPAGDEPQPQPPATRPAAGGGAALARRAPAREVDYRTLALEDALDARDEADPFSADAAPLEVFSLAFFGNDLLAAGSEERIFLWNRRKPQEGLRSIQHVDFVYSVAFSPDGKWLASGAQDGSVRIHNLGELNLRWPAKFHGDAVYSVAFSPDPEDSLLASGGYDNWVVLWNAVDGTRQGRLKLDARVTSVAFAPEQPLLAIGDLENRVWVWDYAAKDAEPQPLGEHASSVESVAFSPDGRLVASAGLDKRIRLWEVATGAELWTGPGTRPRHGYLVRSVVFSPNGEVIASASWDETVGLWSVADGARLCELPTRELESTWHKDWIWAVAFSQDGTVLASAGSGGKIILLAVEEPVREEQPLAAAY